MRRYTLKAEEFQSLASGYGSQPAIAKLVGGQLVKRRLLVYAVAKDARDVGGAPARIVAPAISLLIAAEARAPSAVRDLLVHPHIDAWANRCLRLPHPGQAGAGQAGAGQVERLAAEVGYLSGLAVTAAVRASLAFEIDVYPAAGAVTLPCLGGISGLGEGVVRVRGDGTSLSLTGSAGFARVPAPYDRETEHWTPRRELRLDESPAMTIAIEDVDQYRDCYPWRGMPRLDSAEALRWERLCDQAWRMLRRDHTGHASAMRVAWRSMVPLRSRHPGGNYSATSRSTCGAIGVALPGGPATLAMLIMHEFQHLKLWALLDLVDLYRPGGPARYLAPWRTDPRPVGALLQGTYAHLGVADFWRVRRLAGDGDARRAEFEFAYWRIQVSAALTTLVASAELTEHGQAFAGHLGNTVASFQDEQVSARAEAAAHACALARTAAWQLTNHQVIPAEVARAARAWRAGQPCPPLPPPRVVEVPAARAEPPRLAELIRWAWCAEPGRPGPDPGPGDRAVLAGDHGLAVRAYAASIRQDADRGGGPGYDDWVGLAVALALSGPAGAPSGRLALARAVYSAVSAGPGGGAGPASPEAVARWCDAAPAVGDPAPG